MTRLAFHRFANIFPLIEGEERDALAEDIRLKGVIDKIVLFEEAILDGRNRYCALERLIESGAPLGPGWGERAGAPLTQADLDPWALNAPFRRFSPEEDGDALDFVESKNLARRDLTPSQRAACAAEIGGLKQGRPRETNNPANLQLLSGSAPGGASREDRAERYHVSERTLADADKVHAASPELHHAVKQGEVTADVAAALAEKPAEEVKALIEALPRDESGKLTAEAKREVRKVATELRQEKNEEKKQRRAEREREQGAMQLAAPGQKYGVILADPEWRFEPYSRETGMDRAVDNHYATSPAEEIMARRALIDEIAADDSVLGLWTTQDHLATACKVMEAWGFTYKSCRTWVTDVVEKPIDPATCKALGWEARRYLEVVGSAGPGFWGRSRAQFMLIGTRGSPACPAQGLQGESVWFAARPHHEGTRRDINSAKPEETAHDWFDTHFPSFRKVELNARAARPGWDRWGLEAPRGEGWIGPIPAGEPKFAPADDDDDEAESPIEDEGDGTLPPFPWDAAHAAEAAAESENEAAEAAGSGAP